MVLQVSGLPSDVSEQELQLKFGKIGELKRIKVYRLADGTPKVQCARPPPSEAARRPHQRAPGLRRLIALSRGGQPSGLLARSHARRSCLAVARLKCVYGMVPHGMALSTP